MHVSILAPTTSTNAVGRGLALAGLCGEMGVKAVVFGPQAALTWPGAERYPGLLHAYSSEGEVIQILKAERGPHILWAVKPHPTSWSLAASLGRVLGTKPVLDVDDHDLALSLQFRQAARWNRVRVHRFHPLHPRRIAHTLAVARADAAAFTFSTHALATVLRLSTDRPSLRVPHPRLAASPVGADERSGLHLGFLGTPRAHKGMDHVLTAVRLRSDVRLHMFDPPPREFLELGAQLALHRPTEDMATLYSLLDATLLPMDHSVGAKYQLPAKLIDSMQFGVAPVVSPTPAIREIAGNAAIYVEDWRDSSSVDAALSRVSLEGRAIGARARRRYLSSLTGEVIWPSVRELFSQIA